MIKKLRDVLNDPASLTGRALQASLWSIGASVMRHPLRLVGNLIMVRLLAPEAFGLMSAVMVLHMGLSLFADIGILQSVMRSDKGEEPRFLRIVWCVQILRGFALAAGLAVIAFAIQIWGPELAGPDTVYADPRLPSLLYVWTITVLARGFESSTTLLARRRMQLGRFTAMEISAQAVGIVAMVGLGIWLGTVWALLLGQVVAALFRVVLSHTMFPGPRMGFAWDRDETRDLWSFGKWLIIASLGGFFSTQADRLILGTLIAKDLLGIYAIAVVWTQMGLQLMQRIGGAIFIPSFSTILRERPGRIGAALNRTVRVFSLASWGMFLALAVLGGVLIDLLYPPAYEAAKIFVPLLAFQVTFVPFLALQQFLTTLGLTRDVAFIQIARGVMAVLAVYAGYWWHGMEGSVLGFALSGAGSALLLALHPRIAEHVDRRLLAALALLPFLIAGLYWELAF